MTNFSDYTNEIIRISNSYLISEENKLSVYALGLAGETGEVCELLKKYIRDGVLDEESLAKELGDVLAYLTLIANSFGFTLEEIAKINLSKLAKRESKGTLHGSGNNR
jgi:NTP pyrophosphatase (non-canonical NTP hydrolase)